MRDETLGIQALALQWQRGIKIAQGGGGGGGVGGGGGGGSGGGGGGGGGGNLSSPTAPGTVLPPRC